MASGKPTCRVHTSYMEGHCRGTDEAVVVGLKEGWRFVPRSNDSGAKSRSAPPRGLKTKRHAKPLAEFQRFNSLRNAFFSSTCRLGLRLSQSVVFQTCTSTWRLWDLPLTNVPHCTCLALSFCAAVVGSTPPAATRNQEQPCDPQKFSSVLQVEAPVNQA